jgi:dipeptidyl aminopeptidase/acylaminoacyl peptidase
VRTGTTATLAGAERVRDPGTISTGVPISFAGREGEAVYGFWYEPTKVAGPPGPPPLVLHLHGGPTDCARLSLDPELQLWTSRGFALLDLNYSGSTGFGSAYRHRLDGAWGERDLGDCIAAVTHLAGEGLIDPERVIARGASAGGYLTLRCVTATGLFCGGASRCGIADLALWREDTHDFESRYADLLVGPDPHTATYAERSPARKVTAACAPLLLVHGLADTVVPPEHAAAMAGAYRAAGRPCEVELLADEPHGLRRADSRRRWLARELAFVASLLQDRCR